MGSRAAFRGTQKKVQKELTREALREIKRQRPFTRGARRELESIMGGAGAPETDLQQLISNYNLAAEGADKFFAPVQEKAISDWQRYTQPSLAMQFTPGGSAHQQALKESSEDLMRSLAADFANMRMGLASGLTGQQYQNQVANLNARSGAAAQLLGQNFAPQAGLSATLTSPYMQSGNRGPNGTQQIIGSGIQAAGTIAGAKIAGPPGAVAGNAAATKLTQETGLTPK